MVTTPSSPNAPKDTQQQKQQEPAFPPPNAPVTELAPEDTVALGVFKKLDLNGDGKLSKEELRAGLRVLHLPNTDKVVDTLVARLDRNNDGEVSLEEFRTYTVEHSKQLRKLFESIDEDKSEFLDVHELKRIISKVHGHIDDKRLGALVSKIDVDKDGRISFDEWKNLLLFSPASELKDLFDYWSDAQALDQGDEGFVVPPDRLKSAVGYLTAGAAAGIVSRTGTAPFERLKIMYQVNHGKTPPLTEGFKSIWKDGGFRGLFRGNLANILKVAPESSIKFFTYELAKEFLSDDGKKPIGNAERFIAGAGAGVVAHTSMFPLEVIKTKLAASPGGTYNGIFDVVRQTYAAERSIAPLYRGLSASIISTIPHSGINMMVYEGFKIFAVKATGKEEPGPSVLLAAATTSSVCGQVVGYPFHVVKARLIMQVKKGAMATDPQQGYTGIVDAFQKIIKAEGPRGLFKGIAPSFIKSVPAHGLTFLVYEYFKKFLNIDKKKKHH